MLVEVEEVDVDSEVLLEVEELVELVDVEVVADTLVLVLEVLVLEVEVELVEELVELVDVLEVDVEVVAEVSAINSPTDILYTPLTSTALIKR